MLLFGYEKWVLNPQLEKSLEGFHHGAAQRMAGMIPKRQQDGTWVYPPIRAALEMLGLQDIRVYTVCHQKTAAQYIVTHPIIDFCLAVERKPGMRLSRRWWENPALDITRIKAGQAAAEGR